MFRQVKASGRDSALLPLGLALFPFGQCRVGCSPCVRHMYCAVLCCTVMWSRCAPPTDNPDSLTEGRADGRRVSNLEASVRPLQTSNVTFERGSRLETAKTRAVSHFMMRAHAFILSLLRLCLCFLGPEPDNGARSLCPLPSSDPSVPLLCKKKNLASAPPLS